VEGDAEHHDMLESVKQLVQNRCSPMVARALQHVSFPARALPGVYDEGALDVISDSNNDSASGSSSSSNSGDGTTESGAEGPVISTRRYRRARPAGSVPCRLAFSGSGSAVSSHESSRDRSASEAQLTAHAAATALDGAVVNGRSLIASALGIVDAKTRAGDELDPEDYRHDDRDSGSGEASGVGAAPGTSANKKTTADKAASKVAVPTGCVVLLYHLCAASELEDPEEAEEVLDNVRLLVGGALPPSAAGPEHALAAALAPSALASKLLGTSWTPTPPPLPSTSVEAAPAEAPAEAPAAVNVDILWLRAEKGGDPERFRALLAKRDQPGAWVDKALASDAAWRASVTKQQALVAEANKLQKEVIGPAKKTGQDCDVALKRVMALKQEAKALLEPAASGSGEVTESSGADDDSSNSNTGKPLSIATLEVHAKVCLAKLGKVVVKSRVGNLVELAELDEVKAEADVGSNSDAAATATNSNSSDKNSCNGIVLPTVEGFPVAIALRSSVLAAYACERLDGAVLAGQHLRAVIADAAPPIDLPPPPPPKPRATAAVFVPGTASGGTSAGGAATVSGTPGAAPGDSSVETGSTGGSAGGVSGKEGEADGATEEVAVVLTRNGKKIPVKYAPTKAVPKVPNAQTVREYVTQQRLDPELDALCFELVEKLFQFQERVRLRDPTKAKQRRRLVFGLREVKRGIKLGQVKCVVVAPNIDEGNFAGGLDDTVNEIISLGRASEECTVLFALSKKKLGKALGKNVRVSAVGIYSMDGAYDAYKKIVKLLPSLA